MAPAWLPSLRRRPSVPAEYAHLPEGDRHVLAALLKEGADLTRPRHVLQYVDLPTEAAALAAAADLAGSGWSATISLADECCDPGWSLEAGRQRTLTPGAMEQDARLFTDLAARHGGEYDGWSASV